MERVKFQEGYRGSLPAAGAAGVVPKLNAIFSQWGREEGGGKGRVVGNSVRLLILGSASVGAY